MRTCSFRWVLAGLVGAAALGVLGCGGGPDPAPPPSGSPATAATSSTIGPPGPSTPANAASPSPVPSVATPSTAVNGAPSIASATPALDFRVLGRYAIGVEDLPAGFLVDEDDFDFGAFSYFRSFRPARPFPATVSFGATRVLTILEEVVPHSSEAKAHETLVTRVDRYSGESGRARLADVLGGPGPNKPTFTLPMVTNLARGDEAKVLTTTGSNGTDRYYFQFIFIRVETRVAILMVSAMADGARASDILPLAGPMEDALKRPLSPR